MNQQLQFPIPFRQQAMVALPIDSCSNSLQPCNPWHGLPPVKRTPADSIIQLGSGQRQHHKHNCHLSRSIYPRNMGRLGDFLWTKKTMHCSAKWLNCFHESGWWMVSEVSFSIESKQKLALTRTLRSISHWSKPTSETPILQHISEPDLRST